MTVFSRNHVIAALALGATALVASPVLAGEVTGNLNLNVAVQSNCSFDVLSDISFPTYTAGGGVINGSTIIETLGCPDGTVVKVNGGLNYANDVRRMKNGQSEDFLRYRVLATSFDDWSASGEALPAPDFDGKAMITLRGQVFAGQWAVSGNYSDTLVITLDFP